MKAAAINLPNGATLRHAETDGDLRACWPVMQQLRPHLVSVDDFISRVHRQRTQGYRLLAVWQGNTAVALAGYRLQENLVYGHFLYLDDLVTDASARGSQWGARLIEAMAHTASEAVGFRVGVGVVLGGGFWICITCTSGLLYGDQAPPPTDH